jgi:hypothetical protein
MDSQILDSILLPLADQFEAASRNWQTFSPSSPELYEPLRECLAELRAQQFITEPYAGAKSYRFTPTGYAQFSGRIRALRELSRVFPHAV